MHRSDPTLHILPIDEIRPTQMTLGFLEVVARRKKWRTARTKDRDKLLRENFAPGVIGPKGRFFIVDHHHLVRALHEEGCTEVFVQVLADFSRLDIDEFWLNLDHKNWVHTYNEDGRRVAFSEVPRHIADLKDDPYRSLAGAVRRAGGFAKEAAPYAEFLWASFFRSRIDPRELLSLFEETVDDAIALAHGPEASYLPGWCGSKA